MVRHRSTDGAACSMLEIKSSIIYPTCCAYCLFYGVILKKMISITGAALSDNRHADRDRQFNRLLSQLRILSFISQTLASIEELLFPGESRQRDVKHGIPSVSRKSADFSKSDSAIAIAIDPIFRAVLLRISALKHDVPVSRSRQHSVI